MSAGRDDSARRYIQFLAGATCRIKFNLCVVVTLIRLKTRWSDWLETHRDKILSIAHRKLPVRRFELPKEKKKKSISPCLPREVVLASVTEDMGTSKPSDLVEGTLANGRGCTRTESTMVKIALFAPMPSARVMTTTAVKPGAINWRVNVAERTNEIGVRVTLGAKGKDI